MAESKKFLLRLDPRLFEALRRWADDDLRSINAQIEYLLTDQARRAGRLPRQNTRRSSRDSSTDAIDLVEPTAVTTSGRARR
ncbi:MAG: hypothetical protein JOZ98_06410 [Solirubrobacterales bacterium]|nr:hypothetical protein [Solirubrobacterales bacterium]MBV9422522.1 hypothetical protein [Solirubrobacterales bacterium]MBV9799283.1 hypothetical protein [Solirubrobacterales bacterium]